LRKSTEEDAKMANITEVPVTYKDAGGTTLHGFLVHDEARQGTRPGVLVLHEWWGITKHVRDEARYFAGLGYTAFVADLYGGGKLVDNPGDAGNLMNALMGSAATVRSRFDAAREQLAKHATVDPARLAASGYCMGGKIALDMARAGTDLKAVASFHGNLTPREAAQRPSDVLARERSARLRRCHSARRARDRAEDRAAVVDPELAAPFEPSR